eukprot:GHRQ01009822.1.p1 GENE.GHRQ01009822.1~~GHRQ01009822.1.p1  ORF type:complete len:191 (+),score=91.81 GHRQ01009822.1:37-573(+)
MADWVEGASGIQQLVKRHVHSPLQAQQAWQVAVRLQGNPLHKVAGRVLGGAVVALVEVTLANHDHSVLQQLMANRLLRFSFNRWHVARLIRAAAAADVGLEELQALLDMLPPRLLTNQAFFVLIRTFVARQQYTEAGHCFQQMEAAGLRLTPALQGLQAQLRAVRAQVKAAGTVATQP